MRRRWCQGREKEVMGGRKGKKKKLQFTGSLSKHLQWPGPSQNKSRNQERSPDPLCECQGLKWSQDLHLNPGH